MAGKTLMVVRIGRGAHCVGVSRMTGGTFGPTLSEAGAFHQSQGLEANVGNVVFIAGWRFQPMALAAKLNLGQVVERARVDWLSVTAGVLLSPSVAADALDAGCKAGQVVAYGGRVAIEARAGVRLRQDQAERFCGTTGQVVFVADGEAERGGGIKADAVLDEMAVVNNEWCLALAARADHPSHVCRHAIRTMLNDGHNTVWSSTVFKKIAVGRFAERIVRQLTDKLTLRRHHQGRRMRRLGMQLCLGRVAASAIRSSESYGWGKHHRGKTGGEDNCRRPAHDSDVMLTQIRRGRCAAIHSRQWVYSRSLGNLCVT